MKARLFLRRSGRSPLIEHFVRTTEKRELAAMRASIRACLDADGRLPYPLAEHIEGKILALRPRVGNHRIYYLLDKGNIILLDGYQKKQRRIERRILENVRNHAREYLTTRRSCEYSDE